ncbi:MAG: hypothetical protein B6U73_04615 [Desulfurococcales archaeon ex4484_204]|nr:MAG: hypothetical protein B6U73_04615 [Desulfurococcales archaeon ex4484_204]
MSLNDEVYGASVRLRFATLANFTAEVVSYVASLVFVVSVARRLTVYEFGVWTLISRYTGYVLLFTIIFTYWIPRTVSRGINTSKTGLLIAIELGLVASVAYSLIAIGASQMFNQPLYPLLLATIMVFENYVNTSLTSIASAHSPQYLGLARLTLRSVQAGIAVLLVVLLKLGLYGVVASTIIARASITALLYVVNRRVLARSKYSPEVVREWVRRSWLPLYSSFVYMLYTIDAVVVRAITGCEDVLAYYGVSMSVYGLTMVSAKGFPALYARLLARRDVRDVSEAFWIAFMLNIPIVVGVVLYAEALAAVYNPKYVVASQVIRVFAIASIARLLSAITRTTLTGLEERDIERDVRLRETVLFKIPTIGMAIGLVYIGALATTAYLLRSNPVLTGVAWGALFIAYNLVLTVLYDLTLRREFNAKLPYRSLMLFIGKFLIASLGIVVVRAVYHVEPVSRVWTLLSELGPAIALSAAAYFSVLYVIDGKFRRLVWDGLNYLKRVHPTVP